ncbi:MAG: hypothetical protein ABSH08_04005 [Tepidisphaeraceae bacterium]
MADQIPKPVTSKAPEFIRGVLLTDLKRMVYECNLHYLAFGVIAVGIEFLGACEDSHPFEEPRHSHDRFDAGIQRLASIDSRYADYNKKDSPYWLYRFLRCGTAHVMRPHGPLLFSQRSHSPNGMSSHLNVFNGFLSLICEDFYDHFAEGCQTLLQDSVVISKPKLQQTYLTVAPFQIGLATIRLSSTAPQPGALWDKFAHPLGPDLAD